MPDELSDHDLLIRIDASISGREGILDRLDKVGKDVAEAKTKASEALITAQATAGFTKKLAGINAGLTGIGSFLAGFIGWKVS